MPPLRPLSKLDELGDSVRQVIKAYHGSPYDFDKFDARRIGSGEGASAFGHGLYFAGNEGTAKYYQDALGAHDPLIDQKIAELNRLRGEKIDPKISDAIENLRYEIMDLREAAQQRPGRIYEVEIGHPEDSLIDLDAPLAGNHKAAVLRAAFRAPQNKWQRMAIDEAASPETPAQVAMESLMRAHNLTQPNRFAGRPVSQAAVARALFEEGVPGLRYFDQGSRDAGQGTRNYVMFPGTEDSIRILRKY